MAKSGVNKENTKIRRSLNRHCLSLRSLGGLAKGERRFCKQKTNSLIISDLKDSLPCPSVALREGGFLSGLVTKKTSGWLTW